MTYYNPLIVITVSISLLVLFDVDAIDINVYLYTKINCGNNC